MNEVPVPGAEGEEGGKRLEGGEKKEADLALGAEIKNGSQWCCLFGAADGGVCSDGSTWQAKKDAEDC